MCNLADAPKAEMFQHSGGSLPSPPVVLGPGECLKFQCEEGYTVPGTPGGPAWFTVTCEDGIHSMPSCKPVECGVAPVSACAVVNTGAGQAISSGLEVTYDCQLGCHVRSNRSRKSFSRRCQKDGMFDGDLERNRSRARQSSVQSRLSGLLVTEPRERSG